MSLQSFKKHLEAKLNRKEKKHKYGAKKQEVGAYSFSSKLEASVFNILSMQMITGEIRSIQVQDSVKLTDANIDYRPDFKVTKNDGGFYWVEAKGFKTAVWMIKKRLWKCYGPGELHIYEGSHSNPKLAEIVKVNV